MKKQIAVLLTFISTSAFASTIEGSTAHNLNLVLQDVITREIASSNAQIHISDLCCRAGYHRVSQGIQSFSECTFTYQKGRFKKKLETQGFQAQQIISALSEAGIREKRAQNGYQIREILCDGWDEKCSVDE